MSGKLGLATWHECKRCGLHAHRTKVVLGVGDVPADVLIVGEAPGKSEDALGVPFIGPSGRLLRAALQDSGADALRIFIANVCACRPCDGRAEPNREPTKAEIAACHPRLAKTIARVQPKCIAVLGKTAEQAIKKSWPEAVACYHPAYILRNGGGRSPLYRAFVRQWEEIREEIEAEGSVQDK